MKRPLFILVLLICCSLAGAQAVPGLTPSTSTASAAPPEAWDSPQATVQTFIQDMHAQSYNDARNALDLSDVPFPVRDTEGIRYAQILIAVLARTPGFRPEDLPTAPKANTWSIAVRQTNNHVIGDLVMEKTSGGVWQFNSDTVEKLPRYYSTIQNQPQNNEIGVFPDPPADPSMEVRAYIPSFMLHSFLWLEIWQWLGLLVLGFASMVVALLVRLIIKYTLRFFFRHLESSTLPISLKRLRRSGGLWAGASFWWLTYEYLGLQGDSLLILIVFLKAFGIGAIMWVIDALLEVSLDLFGSRATSLVRRADAILIPIAKKLINFVLTVVGLLVFAESMSVNVTGLVAGLGITGLVIALAGKNSVENIFGSLTIIFDMPFGINDYIKIPPVEGTVEEINLRSTRIRTPLDTLVTLPNSNLITASVENYGARRYRRFSFILPLSYLNNLEHVTDFCGKAREFMNTNEKINHDKSHIELTNVSDNAMGVSVELYFLTNDYSEERSLREMAVDSILKLASDAKLILGSLSYNPVNAPQDLLPPPPTGSAPK
ncbi:MAG TPA: mechanosensitive ion channel family protein [Fimbriimonadaceae bacterium]